MSEPSDTRTVPARVDVLITVFNAAATIAGSIRSICEQTFLDLRIVVVDDGSTDETPRLLSELATADARIHLVTTPNRGIVSAANTGLALCDAEYLARHDADDLAFAQRLQAQVAYLDAHPECVAVSSNAFHIGGDGVRTGHVTRFPRLAVGDPFTVPSVEPYLMHPFLLARRQAVVDVGGYRHVLYSEDTDLYWRLGKMGALVTLDEVMGEYRVHGDSISSRSIVNGRIAAVNSQLAAISEQRRRARRADLDFDIGALAEYERGDALHAVVAAAGRDLDEDETAYLQVACAVKLLELSSYRPYRLTRADLGTIRRWIEAHYRRLSARERVYAVFRVILGRSRLRRDPFEAFRLVPWRVMPRATVDLVRYLLGPRTPHASGDAR